MEVRAASRCREVMSLRAAPSFLCGIAETVVAVFLSDAVLSSTWTVWWLLILWDSRC